MNNIFKAFVFAFTTIVVSLILAGVGHRSSSGFATMTISPEPRPSFYEYYQELKQHLIDDACERIAEVEKYQPKPYWDIKRYSIGYGTPAKGRGYLSKFEAKKELRGHVIDIVERLEKKGVDLNSLSANQIIAITSYVYNVGFSGFIQSNLYRKIITKAPSEDIKQEWVAGWKRKSRYSKGLYKSRVSEVNLFLKPQTSIARA